MRVPRAAGAVGFALGAAALHGAVPFQLSRLGGRAGRPAAPVPAARGAGLVAVAAGGALMAWAFAAHGGAAPRGWDTESGLTPRYLLRTGPYRWTRNPMYAGEALAWAGWGLAYGSPAVWAGLAGFSALFPVVVRWEERQLLDRFGEDYRAYMAQVPRWLPVTARPRR